MWKFGGTWGLGLGVLLLGCGDEGGPGTASQASSTTGGDPSATSGADASTAVETVTLDSDVDGTDGSDTTPTSAGLTCIQDGECGQGVGVCQKGVCDAGVCAVVNAPEGTPVRDEPGDCQRTVCDGAGVTRDEPADGDMPAGTPGDCKRVTCSRGQMEFMPDDLDLPDDGVDCTQDLCDRGAPKFEAKPVNSLCGADGEKFCHDDRSCRDCKQVSAACEDESGSEANETQATATGLGTINDADASGSFVCAVLDGSADVDWYTFNGEDAFFNFVDPTREVIADLNHRICVYITCDNGPPSIDCGGDETEDTAPMGQPGCCGHGNISPALNCAGTDDSATIWIRVENVDGLACVPYELRYHF